MNTKAIHKGPLKVAGLGLIGRVVQRGEKYIMEVRNENTPDHPFHWDALIEPEHTTQEAAEGLYELLGSMPAIMKALELPEDSSNIQAMITHRGLHNSNSILAELRVWNLSTRKKAHAFIDINDGLCIEV
jgi:hypothetical protein